VAGQRSANVCFLERDRQRWVVYAVDGPLSVDSTYSPLSANCGRVKSLSVAVVRLRRSGHSPL